MLLKLKYVTIIPYLAGIRKVLVLYVLKVSLSKFARLYKANNIFGGEALGLIKDGQKLCLLTYWRLLSAFGGKGSAVF